MTIDKKKSLPKWLTKIHQFFEQKNRINDTDSEIIDEIVASDVQTTASSNQVIWDEVENLVNKTILALQIVVTVLVQVRSLISVCLILDDCDGCLRLVSYEFYHWLPRTTGPVANLETNKDITLFKLIVSRMTQQ